MWEKHYASTIEPLLGDLIKKLRSRCENVLIRNNAEVLTQAEKFQLALSMLFQLSRSKKARDYTQDLYDRLLPDVARQTREKFGPLSKDQEAQSKSFADERKYFKEISMEVNFCRKSVEKIASMLAQRDFVNIKS